MKEKNDDNLGNPGNIRDREWFYKKLKKTF